MSEKMTDKSSAVGNDAVDNDSVGSGMVDSEYTGKTSIEKVLRAFYNPTTGLTRNIAKLKTKNPQLQNIPAATIRSILDNYSKEYQQNKPFKEVKRFKSYHANYIGELIHADLMFIKSPRNTNQHITISNPETNQSDRYILICVDTYSRYLWVYPLHSKSSTVIKEKFEEMISMIREVFYEGYDDLKFNILTDAGLEFSTRLIESIKNVKHIISKNQHGAVIAESYIYKIRKLIRYLDNTKTGRKKITINELRQIVENINSDGANDIMFNNVEPDEKSSKDLLIQNEFNQGDYVRISNISKKNNTFAKKSSIDNYSDRVFVVLYVMYFKTQQLYTYVLCTVDGNLILNKQFYEEELVKVPFSFLPTIDIEKESKFTKEEIKDLKMHNKI